MLSQILRGSARIAIAVRPKRWLRFSLRTLLAFVLCLRVWLAYEVNTGRRQQRAIAGLKQFGAMFGWHTGEKLYSTGLLDVETYSFVHLHYRPIDDADMAIVTDFLADLPFLTEVTLHYTDISEASLPHLLKLKTLRRIDLSGTKFSESAVQKLRTELPECEVVVSTLAHPAGNWLKERYRQKRRESQTEAE